MKEKFDILSAMDTQIPNIVVFDLETQKTFEEVGGMNQQAHLGVSYVGVYSYREQKFFGFWERDLPQFEKILLAEQPTLIGFNSLHFDVPVLQPYFHKLRLTDLPHIDILRDVEKVLGHRVKLDNIAQATLREGKSASGLDAIRWFREGNFEALARYCIDDVRITRDVYDYGVRHGNIFFPSAGEKKPIPVPWGKKPTISDILFEAFKKHEQLRIEYFEVTPQGEKSIVPSTIEVLAFGDGVVEAFCHRVNNKRRFAIPDIWHIAPTGATFAHQERLF